MFCKSGCNFLHFKGNANINVCVPTNQFSTKLNLTC